MRAVGRHRFQCLGNHFFDLSIRDLPWCAHPRLIQKAVHAIFPKPFAPLADCGTCDVQFPGNLGVTHPVPTEKYDPGTRGHGLGRLWAAGNGLQLIAILIGDFQRFLGTTNAHTQVCCRMRTYTMNFPLMTLVEKAMNDWVEMQRLGVSRQIAESCGDFIVQEMDRTGIRHLPDDSPKFDSQATPEDSRECVFGALDRWLVETSTARTPEEMNEYRRPCGE
jgi:hypothetical protein